MTDNRLELVRKLASELAAQKRHEDYCEFGAPCFVDCPCWHEAERIVNG